MANLHWRFRVLDSGFEALVLAEFRGNHLQISKPQDFKTLEGS